MGGERFESPQPGEYLFGDSDELNFLGNKPVPVKTNSLLKSVRILS